MIDLATHGFAVFTRSPEFTARALDTHLQSDPGVKHLLYVPNKATDPDLTERVRVVTEKLGVALQVVPWETYALPTNVSLVESLPSDALAILLTDQRRTLGDRLDVRRQYMRRKVARRRIVVDHAPYESVPWRVYFPFAFFDRSLLGYHHSYAIEQDYERFLDGQIETNPCDPGIIAAKTWKAAVVDPAYATGFFRLPEVEMVRASTEHHRAYATYRDGLFEHERSIKSVTSKLTKWAQNRYPQRSLPTDLKRIYDPGFTRIVHTDLPFDRWMVGEILGVMHHTNKLLAEYLRLQGVS